MRLDGFSNRHRCNRKATFPLLFGPIPPVAWLCATTIPRKAKTGREKKPIPTSRPQHMISSRSFLFLTRCFALVMYVPEPMCTHIRSASFSPRGSSQALHPQASEASPQPTMLTIIPSVSFPICIGLSFTRWRVAVRTTRSRTFAAQTLSSGRCHLNALVVGLGMTLWLVLFQGSLYRICRFAFALDVIWVILLFTSASELDQSARSLFLPNPPIVCSSPHSQSSCSILRSYSGDQKSLSYLAVSKPLHPRDDVCASYPGPARRAWPAGLPGWYAPLPSPDCYTTVCSETARWHRRVHHDDRDRSRHCPGCRFYPGQEWRLSEDVELAVRAKNSFWP